MIFMTEKLTEIERIALFLSQRPLDVKVFLCSFGYLWEFDDGEIVLTGSGRDILKGIDIEVIRKWLEGWK